MKTGIGASSDIGILIIGHGSREPESSREFETLISEYRARRPNLDIRTAYIELAEPDVKSALIDFAKVRERILVVPLFLFTSGHIKNDLPLILDELKARFPEHEFRATEAIGVEPLMVEILRDRVSAVTLRSSADEQQKTGVVIVGRGASDADANGDFHKLVRLFEEGSRYAFVLPTFVGITRPLFPETLEMTARFRPDRLLIVPYFLFTGRLLKRIEDLVRRFAAQYPWIRAELAPHLGSDPRLFDVLDQKIAALSEGRSLPLPCVTCEYRSQLPGLPNKVGGLKALLWSLRHLETHTQAGPHEFPHKNLRKHVLVCENVDCAERGSIALVSRLRSVLKNSGQNHEIRVTRTSCMGRCGEGPTVVVYPDGIWYQRVQESDAEALVSEHLLQDRIVSRLVDNIMQ